MAWCSRVLLVSVFVWGCGAGGAVVTPTIAQDTSNELGAGDVFDVRVYGEEELSATYQVARDGTIDFPLVGSVHVAGLEPPMIAEKIAELLRERELLIDPQVSILVQEYNSKRISVMGAVGRPGTFPYQPGLTVTEAISLAGGFTNLANRNETIITRTIDGERHRHELPAGRMVEGRAQDVPLRPGDVLFIPERVF